MNLPEGFKGTLVKKEDEELYKMLEHAREYLLEALDDARQELNRRSLPPERSAQVQSIVEEEKTEEESKENGKTDVPLGWSSRILFFLLLWPWLGLLFALIYYAQGYKRKSKETLLWLLYIAVIMFILGCLLGLFFGLSFPNLFIKK